MAAEGKIFVATESGTVDFGGQYYAFTRGVTRVREGHPLLKVLPDYFKPIDVHYEWETATAEPGEKRGAPPVRK